MPSLPVTPLAILCADLHLSHKAPVARLDATRWYDVMAGYLQQLTNLADAHSCPIVCAGDVFDKWNSPPELINFALQELPPMYAVAGNHDLPLHNYADIKRSAYWTLVEAGRITNLAPGTSHVDINGRLRLSGFPAGEPFRKCEKAQGINLKDLDLAVVHRYAWIAGAEHVGAKDEDNVARCSEIVNTYDAVVFGDNHKGFLSRIHTTRNKKNPWVLNCGTFIRRKTDEVSYRPHVGILYSSGEIDLHFLDTRDDRIADPSPALKRIESRLDLDDFIAELTETPEGLDFTQALRRALAGLDKLTKKYVLDAMEVTSK